MNTTLDEMTFLPDPSGESLTLSANPSEPMVFYWKIETKVPLDEAKLRRGIERNLVSFPKAGAWVTIQNGFHWRRCSASQLAIIWKGEEKDESVIWNTPIAFEDGPLWRVWQVSPTVLYIGMHHLLSDGHGSLLFIYQFLQNAFQQPIVPNQAPLAKKTNLWNVKSVVRVIRSLAKRYYLGKRYVPLMLGKLAAGGKPRQHFLSFTLDEEATAKFKAALKRRNQNLTLNDGLLFAFAQALKEYQTKKQLPGERIVFFIPVDIRPLLPSDEVLRNPITATAFDLFTEDFKSAETLFSAIRRESSQVYLERESPWAYLVNLFLFKSGIQKFELKSVEDEANQKGWQFDYTCVFSNLGKVSFPENLNPILGSLFVAPPIKTPTCFSVAIAGIRDSLTIGMRASLDSLSVEDIQFIADRFRSNLGDLE